MGGGGGEGRSVVLVLAFFPPLKVKPLCVTTSPGSESPLKRGIGQSASEAT